MSMMTMAYPPTVRGVDGFEVELACAAQFDRSVLISGVDDDEDRAVAAIHGRSRRAIAPFVAVDCTTSPRPVSNRSSSDTRRTGRVTSTAGVSRWRTTNTILAKVDTIGFTLQGRLLEFLDAGDIRRVGESCVHRKVDVRVIA